MSNQFGQFSGSHQCNSPSFMHFVQLEREDGDLFVPMIAKEYKEPDFCPPERLDGYSFVPVIH